MDKDSTSVSWACQNKLFIYATAKSTLKDIIVLLYRHDIICLGACLSVYTPRMNVILCQSMDIANMHKSAQTITCVHSWIIGV